MQDFRTRYPPFEQRNKSLPPFAGTLTAACEYLVPQSVDALPEGAQLPEISGLKVTQLLKEDKDLAGIPVVAVTAFAMRGDEQRIRAGGCEAYLSKPISVASFMETVRRFIG